MRNVTKLLTALACAGSAEARTLVVQEGGSIRAALAPARSGDIVQVLRGVYREGSPGDLARDGSGTGNCWSGNRFGSSVPSPLPSCF